MCKKTICLILLLLVVCLIQTSVVAAPGDLLQTFASVLAQSGVSTAVTQRLLEHSSSTLTNKIYTNVDPVLRQSVNQLPVEQWLRK